MDIGKAKQQVKDTVEAYLAVDDHGDALLAPASQRPIFLVGAPGIGKTAIMSQIADELDIGLVSYSMTHHTRQSALGLPFIVNREYGGQTYDASEYTMSEIIGSVYDLMRESGRERGILFLDEINCVSETLYPSMLQFLQFKTFGRHKVPDGWVVVTAGNPPEYNRSVHEFDIVTLDRLKRIQVEPDYDAWRAYALEKGVHPAVLTFLDAKKNRFYSVESTLDGKSFVTARAWDDLSDIIRVYEKLGKPVDEALVAHYVQDPRIAGEFAAYYDLFDKYRDDYRIEAILDGQAPDEVLQRAQAAAFDERLSLLGLLLDALESEEHAVMDKTDLLLAVRDDLRAIKEEADTRAALEGVISERKQALAFLAASGGNSKRKRRKLTDEISMLKQYLTKLPDGAAMQDLEALFVADSDIQPEVDAAKAHLGNAFAFLEEAFGDEQEMLIFVTDLTGRNATARFIAQFGSDEYHAHNQKMILSDTQRKLRAYVEDLDEMWEL
ncbi:MAG: AAA family ATPase [Eggerthellaceae bacterium]|nr:AAA family ATPase [Eggerthellaceae bacterium]